MYVVIHTDGRMSEADEPATDEAIRREVGKPGFGMVPMFEALPADERQGMRAFVNDDGFSRGLPRNPVGAMAVAIMEGKRVRVLAGPVVITGWANRGPDSEIRDLTTRQVVRIRENHRAVLDAIAGRPVGDDDWADVTRDMLEYVANAPTPTLSFMSLDEYLDRKADR